MFQPPAGTTILGSFDFPGTFGLSSTPEHPKYFREAGDYCSFSENVFYAGYA
jgi:hypothetical protein